jgi:hypothetical protein
MADRQLDFDGINQDLVETLHWGSVSVTAVSVMLAGQRCTP